MQKVESGQPKEIHIIETIDELKKLLLYSFYISQGIPLYQNNFFIVLKNLGLSIKSELLTEENSHKISSVLKLPSWHQKMEGVSVEDEFKRVFTVLIILFTQDNKQLSSIELEIKKHNLVSALLTKEISWQQRGRKNSIVQKELLHLDPNFYQLLFSNLLIETIYNARIESLFLWSEFHELCKLFKQNNGVDLLPNEQKFWKIRPKI